MSIARRQYSREFKLQVLREIEAGKSIPQASREYEISSSLISKWKRMLKDNPKDAFAGSGNTYKHEAKIAEMERLIGRQAMEIAFLKKALERLRTSER
jgi:transposase